MNGSLLSSVTSSRWLSLDPKPCLRSQKPSNRQILWLPVSEDRRNLFLEWVRVLQDRFHSGLNHLPLPFPHLHGWFEPCAEPEQPDHGRSRQPEVPAGPEARPRRPDVPRLARLRSKRHDAAAVSGADGWRIHGKTFDSYILAARAIEGGDLGSAL